MPASYHISTFPTNAISLVVNPQSALKAIPLPPISYKCQQAVPFDLELTAAAYAEAYSTFNVEYRNRRGLPPTCCSPEAYRLILWQSEPAQTVQKPG